MSGQIYPEFDPGQSYPAFDLNSICAKCGGSGKSNPAKASYQHSENHILRTCSCCGFMWYEQTVKK